MRLCVEVKDPRREPIRLIVEFLRVWYDRQRVGVLCEQFAPDSDLGEYLEAVVQTYESKKADPVETAAFLTTGEEAKESSDSVKVVEVAQDFLAISESAELCYEIGYELEIRGLHTEAVTALHRSTVLNPDNWAA